MQSFPEPTDFDVEAVQDALAVARTQWQRGERPEALRWLRRAIDAAFEEGDDVRGLSLSKAASELQTLLSAPPPAMPRPSRPPAASVVPQPPPSLPPSSMPPRAGAPQSTRPPGVRPPVRTSPPPPTVAPRAVRTAVPASVAPPAPAGGSAALRLPLPAVSSSGPARPVPSSAPSRPTATAAPAPQAPRRNNTRANRRNTRVPVEPGRPSAPPARSVVRAETDMPTLQGERSPLADLDTTIIPMPDLAALESEHAARSVGERTAPFVPAVTAVLTQSVRVAIGPGPTVRVLPASEGLRSGECEAWLTATSPSVDLVAALRPRQG